MPVANLKAKLSIDGKKAQSQIKSLSGRVNAAFSKIKPLAGMLIGGAGAYALTSAIKKTIDFDLALTRLAIQGGKTAAEQKKVRDRIMDVATSTGMAKDGIIAAGKSIIDSTGDFEFMSDTLENLASLAQTTGSDMGLLGKIAGSLKNQFNMDADAANRFMRILVEQGEIGSWTLEEMATTAPKVFAALQMAGVKTEEQIKDATAYMQIFRVGFSTAEEAASAYRGTVARLAMEQDKFEAMGVEFDKDGKARATAEVLVDILDKMNASGYEGPSMVKLFGTENIALVTAMQKTYEEAKAEGKDLTEVMKKYTDVTGDAGDQAKKLDRVMSGTAGQLMTFQQKLDKIIDDAFIENVNDLADLLPEFTALLKFIVDNKEAIAIAWGIGKVATVPGGVGGAALAGGAAIPGAAGKAGKAASLGGAANVLAGAGIGVASAEISKGIDSDNASVDQTIRSTENALGRSLTFMEKSKILLEGIDWSEGMGGWKAPTKGAMKDIFGKEMEGKYGKYEQGVGGEVGLSKDAENAIANAVKQGLALAKLSIEAPPPVPGKSGGTKGENAH